MLNPVRSTMLTTFLALGACSVPPRILEVVPAGDTTDPVGPYRVTAVISEESAVRDLSVIWSSSRALDGGVSTDAPGRVRMSRITDGVYEAAIPGAPVGTVIRYQVQLLDVLGLRQREPGDGGQFELRVLPDAGVLER